MRLSEFILDNLESILQQWEDFARSLKTGHAMSIEALRDDAEQMLRFIAADIESDQTRQQEVAKATGRGVALPLGQLSAAHEHGIARAVDRFSLIELVSEYRALRASVTRMWIEAVPLTSDTVAQLVRFNEAIDQILAEGVMKFTQRMDHDADLFTASVGHDLANPVDAVTTSAALLAASDKLSAAERAAVERIARAGTRLSGMIGDLRDFTRTRLGGLVDIDRKACDIGNVVRDIVDELAAVYPDRTIVTERSTDVVAHVDRRRIAQMVSNLVANALQHAPQTSRVTVRVHGDTDTITIDIHNTGAAIDPERLKTIFEPLSRLPARNDTSRLGLGLYIAQQIAFAHSGTIDVESTSSTGTRFTVRLPRSPG